MKAAIIIIIIIISAAAPSLLTLSSLLSLLRHRKTGLIYNIHAKFLNNVNKPTSFSVRKARTGARLDFFPNIVVYQLQQMTDALDIRRVALFYLHF